MLDKTKTDPTLGALIHQHLETIGVETPMRKNFIHAAEEQEKKILFHVGGILSILGMDLEDDSLHGTPKRVAKMFMEETFWGLDYNNFPKCMVVENKINYDELVVVKKIPITSYCEHHLQLITGTAAIAYLPGKKILGLSKFNRIVEFFARRPQIQERLTAQIWHALNKVLETENIAIYILADHYCVKARGAESENTATATSKMGGIFREQTSARLEFLGLVEK